ncbi:class I SAM-dependent methyltransferase [Gilvimarinus xylanilyticus]|uniref:Methyltransferase n=1 Tax=Gilvimarinus xylanilyticus TaxID=2944139 RepID=A0A9X2HVE5_9GAMM|nr:methyltransferase [Gilvimarinus xylanilyticus]MCP8898885.1 methyltransferase [Gilvimarinus xylanilyticus]
MNDPALQWLLQQPDSGTCVWLCDEHFYGHEHHLPRGEHHLYICNRYDITQAIQAAGRIALFSDFADADLPDSIDTLYYRISKEKPVVHRALNIARQRLNTGAQLHLAGLKNEGAKTYLDKAAKLLGAPKSTQKNGSAYCASIALNERHTPLDDSDYNQLRALAKSPDFITKPGQFGWQKVDEGSAFLLAQLKEHQALAQCDSLLDLGCGYGYLGVSAASELMNDPPAQLVLTDNNAAAILSARENLSGFQLQGEVIAGDCGDTVNGRFDRVLCNPPFHQGFSLSQDLTERFVKSAALHLHRKGCAWFVVNSFIPAEQKAKPYFKKIECIANNKQFKVLALSEPSV